MMIPCKGDSEAASEGVHVSCTLFVSRHATQICAGSDRAIAAA